YLRRVKNQDQQKSRPLRAADRKPEELNGGFVLSFCSLPGLGITAAIDGRTLGAHRAKVSSQLSAVMDTVIIQKAEVCHCGKVKCAHEIQRGAQLLGTKRPHPLDTALHVSVIPLD